MKQDKINFPQKSSVPKDRKAQVPLNNNTRAYGLKTYLPPQRKPMNKSGADGGAKRIVEPTNSPWTKDTPETSAKHIELMQKCVKLRSMPTSEPENKTEPMINSPPRTVRATVDLMTSTNDADSKLESEIHN